MSQQPGRRQKQERSQVPLWWAIAGLAVSLFGGAMKDEMIGNVLMLFGAACTIIAIGYWIFQPKHGMPE